MHTLLEREGGRRREMTRGKAERQNEREKRQEKLVSHLRQMLALPQVLRYNAGVYCCTPSQPQTRLDAGLAAERVSGRQSSIDAENCKLLDEVRAQLV
eukprot:3573171-Rhodomonas_salina.1